MSSDILGQIDTTLEDWEASSAVDAMTWQPSPFPSLPGLQLETVRQVAHDTGLDGYAAWLAVADVMDGGAKSPYAGFVWPEGGGSPGRQPIWADTAAFDQMFRGRRHRSRARAHGYLWLPSRQWWRLPLAALLLAAALADVGSTWRAAGHGDTAGAALLVFFAFCCLTAAAVNGREHVRRHRARARRRRNA